MSQTVSNSVLLVIDVQNCFLKDGPLAVKDGEKIIPTINRLAKRFQNVVATEDFHHPHNISFAVEHKGKKPFDIIETNYGKQNLWPVHCVMGTHGASLHHKLKILPQLILRKGYEKDTDSYSAFRSANGRLTGLSGYLKERGIRHVFIVGLAYDFCVAWSAKDAADNGFDVYVIEDATRGINIPGEGKNKPGSYERETKEMKAKGVKIIQSKDYNAKKFKTFSSSKTKKLSKKEQTEVSQDESQQKKKVNATATRTPARTKKNRKAKK